MTNGVKRDVSAEQAIVEARQLLRELRRQLTELDVFTARTERLSKEWPTDE